MEEGKKFSTKYSAMSEAPKKNPIGFAVNFTCAACSKETTLTFKPGQFDRDYVTSFAELMIGQSRFFVIPVAVDDPGPLGRCSFCGQRALTFVIEERFDEEDIEAGRVNFEAYTGAVGGKTHDNRPIPGWEALTPTVRKGWIVGAFFVKLRSSAFADYPMTPLFIKEGTR